MLKERLGHRIPSTETPQGSEAHAGKSIPLAGEAQGGADHATFWGSDQPPSAVSERDQRRILATI